MKKIILILAANLTAINIAFSQCNPYIQIDGSSSSPDKLALPMWLHAGQTVDMNEAVSSISLIEFTENPASLEYSQVLSITSAATVPSGKVWKIESIAQVPLTGNILNTLTFTKSGTFTVPTCTNYICIEVWGAGGGGGNCSGCPSNNGGAGGGGGGGYGAGCFTVTPGSSLTVTIGAGGGATIQGGTTDVGGLISSTGGGGGTSGVGGAGGTGGTSTAYIQIPGFNGTDGNTSGQGGSPGGAGANGGAGGTGGCNPGAGTAPGGGGGGGDNCNGTTYSGKAGAAGQAKISW